MTQIEARSIRFGPFRLDGANARLSRGGQSIALTPKAFDLLSYLASRPDRLVTKDELLSAVWPDVVVSDASVKVCVREIRKALDDGVKTPRYIETVHRRGYRFIASVDDAAEPEGAEPSAPTSSPPAPPIPPAEVQAPRHVLVGRDAELARLTECFAHAASGHRQCVFVTGSPGCGKTALVETFIERARPPTAPNGPAAALMGHCFEQFGTNEPYLPIWEAIGRFARERPESPLAALLARTAAAHQISASPGDRVPSAPVGEPRGMSERLLRDLVDAVEALAIETTVVLALEDVQWADYSTLDLMCALARRRSAARLMVLATYRPAEALADEHPLVGAVHDLMTAGLCCDITLDFLEEPAVSQYLGLRFGDSSLPLELSRRLHQRTDGHPLFLVHLVDHLVAKGVLRPQSGRWRLADGGDDTKEEEWTNVLEREIPQTVRAMIEGRLNQLERRQRQVLEAGAAAGLEFSAAAAAAGLAPPGAESAGDVLEAEQICEDLLRLHRFLEPSGLVEWPDGTAAGGHRFVHELYHNVVYEQIPIARRVRLHQAIGLRLERAWGSRAGEEAAGLAMHFEHGRDWPRAVKYLRLAADAAVRQSAHREAVGYLRRAASAVERLPEPQRVAHELDVLMSLGVNLQVTAGFAAPEVRAIHARAEALCEARACGSTKPHDESRRMFRVLWGVWLFHKVRSDLRQAADMARRLLEMGRESAEPNLMVQAHQAMCVTALCLGDPETCHAHMEMAAVIYDPIREATNAARFGQDPGVATLAFGAVALWLMDREEEAMATAERSIELARRLLQPSSMALATHFTAMLHQCRGDAVATAKWASENIEAAADEGFSFWLAGGHILRGWARVAQAAQAGCGRNEADAGIDEIRKGLVAWEATGSRTYRTYFVGLLADALLRLDRPDEALAAVQEALEAARTLPEGLYEAALHRLKGRCLLRLTRDGAGARGSFAKAVAVAAAQKALAFEKQAAADLAATSR